VCLLDAKNRIEYVRDVTTTFHLPDSLLADIDRAARRAGMSRNKFVVRACREALSRDAGEWPEGFFDSHLSQEERQLLAEATLEMEGVIAGARRNRGAVAI
jgi:hypothetical protein